MKTDIKPMAKQAIPATYEYTLTLDDEQCAELYRILDILILEAEEKERSMSESRLDFIHSIQTALGDRDLN